MNPLYAELPVLDMEHALRAAGGNRKLVDQLIEMFKDELPERIKTLEAALLDGNRALAGEQAHKISGAAAFCGMKQMQSIAQDLEECTLRGVPCDLSDLRDAATAIDGEQPRPEHP